MNDPTILVAGVALGVALLALYFGARRAITVAELVIEKGVVRVTYGGIAPPILADLRDIAKRPAPIADLRVRITRSRGRAEVTLAGNVTPEQAQRIRNVLGSVPLARLANAPRPRR